MNIENLIAVRGVKAVVIACCEAMADIDRWDQVPAVVDAFATAAAWGLGETIEDGEVERWSQQVMGRYGYPGDAAYWLLAAVSCAVDGKRRMVPLHIEECVEYIMRASGDRAAVVSTILAALEPRDTIPCPPSAECVEHGRAA